jgi:hypothetical protein
MPSCANVREIHGPGPNGMSVEADDTVLQCGPRFPTAESAREIIDRVLRNRPFRS